MTNSYLLPNYARQPVEFVKGESVFLFDSNGEKYLDFTSGIGVANLGYTQPELIAALTEQAGLLWHTPNLYRNSLQEKVAAQLAGSRDMLAFFCNSGTEANEAAIKLIRKHTGKQQIITFDQSFHGRTFGSMSATGQSAVHDGFGSVVEGFVHVPFNDSHALKEAVTEETAAIFLELVQGEGGVVPADDAWLSDVVQLCRTHGLLLAVDEVQTGMGRTGKLYASDVYRIEPDIVTLAKGLGNGIPVGAMLAKRPLAASFSPGTHGSTFGGNKLALSVAAKVVDLIDSPEFLTEVERLGRFSLEYLAEGLKNCRTVTAIRGKGLMLGIEATTDIPQLIASLAEKKLLVLRAGQSVIRLLPPLVISQKELQAGLDIIIETLTKEG
ncbi:acetylornithine transaminase [Vagococcus acidifermentans]|uniref:Acetylornithine aminotransferase n=1 Tax=Vagococcus acidifermentans TaxID=564710 RepID=A0A430AXX6_9ENTE|nr:acetylornithine transaminase [Vagococcus acidifermentans]RSU12921.1 acetylornithine transaminase [Vagococcus acidifermentans]